MILAIDQGTTNTKAVLVDREGHARVRSSVRMDVRTLNSNWVEQDADAIWRSVISAVEACTRQAPHERIEGIAISNQRETVVAWERATGNPVAPAIVWQCCRSEAICEQLRRDGLDSMLRQRTGLSIDTLFSASKMRWLLENIPSLRARAEAGEICFGTVDSWLIWNLSGGQIHACDASNASRTQLLNLSTCAWDSELLKVFGVPLCSLPEIRNSAGVFATCIALPTMSGVPIVSAMGDSHAALAGHGSYAPGTVKATYGTGSSLMSLLPQLGSVGHEVATTIAWKVGDTPQYALEGNIAMTGAAVAWVGSFLGLPRPIEDSIALASSVESSEGVYLVPAMSGLGAPYWDGKASGTISGLTRTSRAAHLARAAVESIAYQVHDVFEAMAKAAGCELTVLYADGGATSNKALMQFQADVLQRPVQPSGCEELSALGAAWLGGIALGWWNSLAEVSSFAEHSSPYLPQRTSAEVALLLHGWRTAVARARLRDGAGA